MLAFAGVAAAQQTLPEVDRTNREDRSARGSIRGRVMLPGGGFVTENVKITLQTLRGTVATIFTETQGQFEFPDLPPALYYLEVEADQEKFEVLTESVQVFRGAPSVVALTLKPRVQAQAKSPADRFISVTELSQNIPSQAKKEFNKASEAANAGRTEDAIAHLRKAISVFPDFVRARNDLGTYLFSLGRLEEAAEELRKAVSIDNKSFNPALNLGMVLVHLQRFAEAAEILRRGLSLEPNSPAANLYLGMALVGLGDLNDAEKTLKTAHSLGGNKYAIALFHLGQIYMSRGERDAATKSFENYLLEVPEARNADQVRKMIALLHP